MPFLAACRLAAVSVKNDRQSVFVLSQDLVRPATGTTGDLAFMYGSNGDDILNANSLSACFRRLCFCLEFVRDRK